MASFRTGVLTEVLERRADLLRTRVRIGGREMEAVGWPAMLGGAEVGDRVVVNTTGPDLDLGTGGVAFILWNLDGQGSVEPGRGHIVKLRYTPWQTEVLAAEEPASPHHDALRALESIDGMPVVVCGLHSQMAAAVAGIKAARRARVGYLMTDGAALPLAWSSLTRALVERGLIDVTCTSGHAFGGHLEAVNVFSGLAALKVAGGADAVVAAMGPGVVGTDTTLGTSAFEQGQLLDAVAALGGRGFACLRISFADPRERHHGVSHHALGALRIAARERCTVVVPELPDEQAEVVARQLGRAGIPDRHEIATLDGSPGLERLGAEGLEVSSMGRSLEEVPELFLAGAAAGAAAAAALGRGRVG